MPLIADSISFWSDDLLDILGAHTLEHVAEQLELAERVARCRLGDQRGDRAEGGAGGECDAGDDAEP